MHAGYTEGEFGFRIGLEGNGEFVRKRRAEKSPQHLLGMKNRPGVDGAEFPIRPERRVQHQTIRM